jgi:hypothetical protein
MVQIKTAGLNFSENPSPDSSGNPFAFFFASKRLQRIAGTASKQKIKPGLVSQNHK